MLTRGQLLELREIPAWYRGHARGFTAILAAACLSALAACDHRGATEPPRSARLNVVLFVLDAARADHFGTYGYHRPATPHIDALAAEATVFEHSFSEASYTTPSIVSLLTGALVHEHGVLTPRALPPDTVTLAEHALQAGYRTYAYSESPFMSRWVGLDQGFTEFESAFPYETLGAEPIQFPAFSSERAIDDMLAWAGANPAEPFFAYLHILRPHNPYQPPAPFLGRFGSQPEHMSLGSTETLLAVADRRRSLSAAELQQVKALYDENLAYGDQLFGRFWQGLRARDLDAHTLLVVCSDHGEAFLEHGQLLHTKTVYDEMTHIPLIIRDPEHRRPRREPSLVQLTDVTATLVDVFDDAHSPHPGISGRSLLPLLRAGQAPPPRPVVSWAHPLYGFAAIRSPEFKVIVKSHAAGTRTWWFDLRKDPTERKPLAAPPSASAAALLEGYGHLVVAGGSPPRSVAVPPDPGAVQRLKALGYLEDGS